MRTIFVTVLFTALSFFATAQQATLTYEIEMIRPDSIFLIQTEYKDVAGKLRPQKTNAWTYKSMAALEKEIADIRKQAEDGEKKAKELEVLTLADLKKQAEDARAAAAGLEKTAQLIEKEIAKQNAVSAKQ